MEQYIQKSGFRLSKEAKKQERIAGVVSILLAGVIWYAYFTTLFK